MEQSERELPPTWLTWPFSGVAASGWVGEVGLLVARLYLDYTICRAGASKFPTIDWFQEQVAGMGAPMPATMAFVASASEAVGGALLILGLLTRPAAFFCAVTMGAATFGFHKNAVGEIHIAQLYFWMFVMLTLTGAGRLSIDALLRRRDNRNDGPATAPPWLAGVAIAIPLALLGVAGWLEAQPPTPPVDPAAEVESVSLAGSFNAWNVHTTPMTRGEDGVWRADFVVESPGEIQLKFVVNDDWRSNLGDSDQTERGLPASGVAELDSGSNSTANIRAYIPAAGAFTATIDPVTRGYRVFASER